VCSIFTDLIIARQAIISTDLQWNIHIFYNVGHMYTANSQWFKAGTALSCSILEEKVTWVVARRIINRANNYLLHFPKTSNISVISVYKGTGGGLL
jgi:hypothetical protein